MFQRWSRRCYRLMTLLFGCSAACMFALAIGARLRAQTVGDPLDITQLPIGDEKISDTPQVGYVYRCGGGQNPMGIGGAQVEGPWIRADGTFDLTAKAIVDGNVMWDEATFEVVLVGDVRLLTGNNLPTTHGTGIYPISASDDAYAYDRNPNSISEQTMTLELPANPTLAAEPGCLTPGGIGVLTTGVVIFDALDALNRDAVAHETQDGCGGHPEITGAYHYHSLTECIEDEGTGHSVLVGYAMDGFGIYGVRGEDGQPMTNADLDECHGHTHEIEWDGQMVEMYHYHATYEYPYTLGCFKGTSVVASEGGGGAMPQGGQTGQGGQPPGGQPPPPPSGGQGGQPPPPPGSGG
ncbi:MAG: YHYH protein [Chloroflexota bacterium]|nr:YHYH protein [Chloroflexota bacterium]